MGTYLATAEKLNANSNCQQILMIEKRKRKRKSKHEEKYMIIATLLIMLVPLIEEHAE